MKRSSVDISFGQVGRSRTRITRDTGYKMTGTGRALVPGETGFGPGFANENRVPPAPMGSGLHAATRLATPHGPIAITDLQPGMAISTRQGPITVRHVIGVAHESHALRLRAPYFGLDQDLIVGRNHHISVTHEVAEYLFGVESVHVPVWALRDNRRVIGQELTSRDSFAQVQLDRDATLMVGRCDVSGMNRPLGEQVKVLDEDEARAFAAEYRSGFFN